MKAQANVYYCPITKSIGEAVPAFVLVLNDEGKLEFQSVDHDVVAPTIRMTIEAAHKKSIRITQAEENEDGDIEEAIVDAEPGSLEHFGAFIESGLGSDYFVMTPYHGN